MQIGTLPRYPGYLIYSNGKVFSLHSNKFLSPGLIGRKDGSSFYEVVNLKTFNDFQETVRVHRLIAQTFIPNPNGYSVVNHKDGNKQNNDVSNLEWCTYSYNNLHAYATGLKKGKRKLTDLKDLFEDYISLKYSRKELKKKYSWYTSRGFNGYLAEYAKSVNRLPEFEYAKAHLKSASNGRAKSKKVLQLSLLDEPIKEWDSATQAYRALGIPNSNISQCCQKKVKSAGGFHWQFI